MTIGEFKDWLKKNSIPDDTLLGCVDFDGYSAIATTVEDMIICPHVLTENIRVVMISYEE